MQLPLTEQSYEMMHVVDTNWLEHKAKFSLIHFKQLL